MLALTAAASSSALAPRRRATARPRPPTPRHSPGRAPQTLVPRTASPAHFPGMVAPPSPGHTAPRVRTPPASVPPPPAASDTSPAANLINNDGLSAPANGGNFSTVTHAAAANGATSWATTSAAPDYFTAGPNPVL